MKARARLVIWVLAAAWLLPGCFPDGELGSVSFRLALKDLGLERADQAIGNWQDWLDNGDPLNPAFDMGSTGMAFYLGLALSGQAPDGELIFLGNNVTLVDDLLEVQLDVTGCTDCQFSAVIFWEDAEARPTLSTFAGFSPEFDVVQGTTTAPVEMDVYLEPTGTIRCRVNTAGYQGPVVLAAFDVDEQVIFPPVSVTSDGGQVEILLEDIPAGRTFNILSKTDLLGAYHGEAANRTSGPVTVGGEGEVVDVVFDFTP